MVMRSRPLAFIIRLAIVADMIACGYLLVRAVRRSLYATNVQYLNPDSWLDTPYALAAVMVVFASLVLSRNWVEARPLRPLIQSRADDDAAIRRRRDSKRFNERLKLICAALNTAGTAALVAGFVVPNVSVAGIGVHVVWSGVMIAFACYGAAQLVVGLWKTEE